MTLRCYILCFIVLIITNFSQLPSCFKHLKNFLKKRVENMLLQAKLFKFLLFANCNLVDTYLCIRFTFTCTAHDTAKLNFIQLKSYNILFIEKGLWAAVVMKNTHVTYVTNGI